MKQFTMMDKCAKHHILHRGPCPLCLRERAEGREIPGLRGERWGDVQGNEIKGEVTRG